MNNHINTRFQNSESTVQLTHSTLAKLRILPFCTVNVFISQPMLTNRKLSSLNLQNMSMEVKQYPTTSWSSLKLVFLVSQRVERPNFARGFKLAQEQYI
jgi:hypothetical protein